MKYLNGKNNKKNIENKHAINIKEVNETLLKFFDENIYNLFNINEKFIKEDIKGKVFDKNLRVPMEDLAEILVQLYFIDLGFEYVVYSHNLESLKEKAKNFDGIFLYESKVYYLEVKTKLESDNKSYKKDVNSKIKKAYTDILNTKIKGNEEYNKLMNYCETHFSTKDRNYNFSKSFDELYNTVENDIDNESFNLICAGTFNTDDKCIEIEIDDIEEIENLDKKIISNHVLGLNHSIVEEFIIKIKGNYGI